MKHKPLHILIAEDDHINQLIALANLRKCGYEVDLAENGKIAVDKFSKNPYDLILMDIQMPEMDGYEATRKIRAMEKADKKVKIIALTTSSNRAECIDAGMDEYAAKPFRLEELVKKMKTLNLA